MAPKKAKAEEEAPASNGAKTEDTAPKQDATNGKAEEVKEETKAQSAPKNTKKRKSEDLIDDSSKRRSSRGGTKAQPSQQQLLNFLLSDKAADMCRPDDEIEALKEHKDMKTYSNTAMSPFEELLCAVVLSRPISHRLGLRSIRTILNNPYNFTSPKAIKDAGQEKRHQALWDARTQHKGKTAEQIGLIAEVVSSDFAKNDSDTSLDKVREEANQGWDAERDLLQSKIKGLGKTGLDIFFRRVQWLWPEAFPYVDERTGRGIEKLGLPKNPNELLKALDEHWGKLDTGHLAGDDKAEKRRRAFVVLCERATGADLEGKTEALVEAAASS